MMDFRNLATVGFLAYGLSFAAQAQDAAAPALAPQTQIARFDILAYQVLGNTRLSNVEIERAVYPFLGPKRTETDVESARAALQALYNDKGFPTAGVTIPEQDAASGLVTLQVDEQRVGRLRVVGADYYSPDDIARAAPSLAEGEVPNFKDVQRDIVALNQLPDRRVTPEVKPGATPGTVDVDLNVEDALPLHGSLELNNRNSANTSELRLSGSVRYDNLWQRGHSLSLSAQVAPQQPSDAKVFSASYLARFQDSPWSLLGYAVRSDSEVAALADLDVIGNGTLAGLRAIRAFPSREGFFHSLSAGVDYKHFKEDTFGLNSGSSPIEYYPLVLAYNADWVRERWQTNLSTTVTANTGGIGFGDPRCGNPTCDPTQPSEPGSFDDKRFNARPSFFHLRIDGSYTRTLGEDTQLFARLQTQFATQPLISNEEFSIGGLDTVRGYDESAALGDFGAATQFELRSPSFGKSDGALQETRLRAFVDAGYARIHEPLAEQIASETLVSTGIGATLKAFEHFNGSVDVAAPLSSPGGDGVKKQKDVNVLFRLWGEF